jgi:hypothetical protein
MALSRRVDLAMPRHTPLVFRLRVEMGRDDNERSCGSLVLGSQFLVLGGLAQVESMSPAERKEGVPKFTMPTTRNQHPRTNAKVSACVPPGESP